MHYAALRYNHVSAFAGSIAACFVCNLYFAFPYINGFMKAGVRIWPRSAVWRYQHFESGKPAVGLFTTRQYALVTACN